MTHRSPFLRLFSPANILTPIAIDRWQFAVDGVLIEYRYLFIFGIRVARWNAAP